MAPPSVPIRESIPSASPIPLSNGASRQASTMLPSPLTPPDIPTMIRDGMGSSSVDDWRRLLANARSSFESERRVWEQERQLYQADIARLHQALDAKQQDMLVMATKLKQAELAVADPRSFHPHIVSPPPGSGARASPVRSPPSTNASRCFISPPVEGASSRHSGTQSPSGMQRPVARFYLSHHGGGEGGVVPGPPAHGHGTGRVEDEPASPVTTAVVSSPLPEHYRRHAGHTPGKMGLFSAEATPGEKTPRAPQPPAPDDQVSIRSDSSEDEDPAIQEPLFLPSHPAKSDGSAMLGALQEKLASISENPEEQTPAVLQGASPSISSESDVDASNPAERDEVPRPAEGEVPGIRLRTKRSCNFGAPIGLMPRYRNHSDFEDF